MRSFRVPTRFLVVSASVLAIAASVLAVTASAQSGSGPSHRTRPFHLTKECSEYEFGIGSYCTVTSANVPAIPAGARVFYAQAPGPETLDADIILYAGRGNTATGHCTVDNVTGNGACRLFGGTGTLDGFNARVDVTYLGGPNYAWDGTYRFRED